MTNLIKSAALMLALTIPFSAVYAKTVSIGGNHTPSEIKGKCTKAGGTFYSKGSGKSLDFGCLNFDKGTAVYCKANGKCTGQVPQ